MLYYLLNIKMALRKIPMTARTKSNQIMAKVSGVKSLAWWVSLKPMSSKSMPKPSYWAKTMPKSMTWISKSMPKSMTWISKSMPKTMPW